jgi:cytochrome c biogenesis protein
VVPADPGLSGVSTSLCIARNTPKILADLQVYKENIREQSLKAFHHKAEADRWRGARGRRAAHRPAAGQRRLEGAPAAARTPEGPGWMVAAKAGAANKIGYIAAHSAIVLVCLGGLLDGDLIVRAQMLLGGKTPYTGGGLIADVKPEHRLSAATPPSAATCWWPRARSRHRHPEPVRRRPAAGAAVRHRAEEVHRRVLLHRHAQAVRQRDRHPRQGHRREDPGARRGQPPGQLHRGIEIYQSSFDDGGSAVKLRAVPMAGRQAVRGQGTIGRQLTAGQGQRGPTS